jgi:hypothetical protein
MFLAWLLDPQGSHRLGSFALKRLLLAVANESFVGPKTKIPEVRKLSVVGNFDKVKVTPNERDQKEKAIPIDEQFKKTGRLDILIENISVEEGLIPGRVSAVVLVEQKVFAPPDTAQCQRYHNWLCSEPSFAGDRVLRIPILLSPFDSTVNPIDDDQWFILDYQRLHDDVLVPSLAHQSLDERARPFLEQYVDTLRIPVTGTKLANSQEEIDLANELYNRHKTTFHRLWEILAQDVENPNLNALVQASQDEAKSPLVLTIELDSGNEKSLKGDSGSDLLREVVKFLDTKGKLVNLLPYSPGGKRYLVAEEATHSDGKPFKKANKVDGKDGKIFYIETNSSRDATVKYALRMLRAAGFTVTVPDN